MTAALILIAAASTYPDLFWARDLGGLARAVAEDAPLAPDDPGRLYFAELIAFCSCAPLPKLEDDAPWWGTRTLLRIEASRRGRLQAAQAASIWKALTLPGFFRRDPGNPPEGAARLEWPQEEEQWPGEQLLVAEPISRCDKPARADELAAAPVPSLARLSNEAQFDPRLAPAAARAWFHRALSLQRSGQAEGARAAVSAVQQDALDAELVPWLRLLRVELGVDEAAGWAQLAREPALGDAQRIALLRASDVLLQQNHAAEFLALAAEVARGAPQTAPDPLSRVLQYRLALASALAGRSAETLAILAALLPRKGGGALEDALEDLALRALAGSADPAGALHRVDELFATDDRVRARSLLGNRALANGNTPLADAVARSMLDEGRRRRWESISLSARSAFARNDARAYLAATAPLLPALDPREIALRDRAERTDAALAVLGSAVEQEAATPRQGWHALLVAQIAHARDALTSRAQPALDRLSLLLASSAELPARGAPPVALGTVRVESRPALVPLPPLAFVFPDPFSLLAIPGSDGAYRAWFERP
jgi:hypothetical protein